MQDKIQTRAEEIELSAKRMVDLIENLLSTNRLEMGAGRFNLQPQEIRPYIINAVQRYYEHARNKNITIVFESPEEDTIIDCDTLAFEQIIDNLVSNAVKYSYHKTQVFVRLLGQQDVVRLEVQDAGPGLTEQDKSQLFGKFTKLSARPTGNESSTGLGLSIVKKLVEMHNGKVWCDSVAGQGATFVVEFPISQAQERFPSLMIRGN